MPTLISESIKINHAMIYKISFLTVFAVFISTVMKGNDNASITLYAGTPVYLEMSHEVSSQEVEIGHTVELFVSSDVTVNGKVVIATGSIAEGRVMEVEKACGRRCNKGCATLSISVESVQAVDGQRLYLRSIPLEAKGDCYRGTPAIISLGTKASARILNNTKINA